MNDHDFDERLSEGMSRLASQAIPSIGARPRVTAEQPRDAVSLVPIPIHSAGTVMVAARRQRLGLVAATAAIAALAATLVSRADQVASNRLVGDPSEVRIIDVVEPSMPLVRDGLGLVIDNDRVFVWGGAVHSSEPKIDSASSAARTNEGAIFDPATQSWTPVADSPLSPMLAPVGVSIGGQVVIVADRGAGGEPTAGATFNPSTGSWRSIAAAPEELCAKAAVAIAGRVLAFGRCAGDAEDMALAASYDPAADSWVTMAGPPVHVVSQVLAVDEGVFVWDADANSGALKTSTDAPWEPVANIDGREQNSFISFADVHGQLVAVAQVIEAGSGPTVVSRYDGSRGWTDRRTIAVGPPVGEPMIRVGSYLVWQSLDDVAWVNLYTWQAGHSDRHYDDVALARDGAVLAPLPNDSVLLFGGSLATNEGSGRDGGLLKPGAAIVQLP